MQATDLLQQRSRRLASSSQVNECLHSDKATIYVLGCHEGLLLALLVWDMPPLLRLGIRTHQVALLYALSPVIKLISMRL